ncbi:MAG: biopolymer transporter ExbD [Oligoflexia bacterium]|nr:biopolymer transporter ExbD [Oligoflexia bacterium]MBF0365101.1 biopolymer transporter ExbD [Oligoflexia bacterium]
MISLRRKSSVKLEPLPLNITSLMDVLTVLLFFLIRFFTVNPMTLSIPKDIALPKASVNQQIIEALVISLSKNELRIQGHLVVTLEGGSFKKSDLAPNGVIIPKVQTYLASEIDKRKNILEDNEHPTNPAIKELPPGKVIIQVDKDLTFDTIKRLLHTATKAGHGDFQFLVTTIQQ